MQKKLPDPDDILGQLRICRFCGRVFKDGDTEIETTDDGKGIVEKCPYCKADQGEFNENEETDV